MIWLAGFLEFLKFLEFLTSSSGLTIALWLSLYSCLLQISHLESLLAASLALLPALHLYYLLERSNQ
jgi:hypothetical protein